MLWRYLGGAAASRAGDEMTGPALLLLGFAVTGRPGTGSALLASLTVAAAAGGPLFGALLDRSPRPDRVLAVTLCVYAAGIIALAAAVGRLPVPLVGFIALAAGLFNPAVAGGWTSQLPRVVTGPVLDRGFALDAMTYSAASLAARPWPRWSPSRSGPGPRSSPRPPWSPWPCRRPAGCRASPGAGGPRAAPHRQVAAGFAAIIARPALLRATVTSVVSYAGIGMLLVCCPVLGAHRLGGRPAGRC